MDPKLNTNERKLREDILQHEFPFDEKAWASMEALLNQGKNPEPTSGLPPKHVESLPGPSRSWTLMLVLLGTFSLGAASLFWWKQPPDKALSVIQINDSSDFHARDIAEIKDKTARPSNQEASYSKTNTPIEKHSNTIKIAENQSFTSISSSRLKGKKAVSNQLETGQYQETYRSEAKNSQQASTANLGAATEQTNAEKVTESIESLAASSSPLITPSATEHPLSGTLLDLALLPIPAIRAIEYTALEHIVLDSLIQPIKKSTASEHRKHRGWILGLNANTVDNNPLRMSVLPHFGYFTSYPLNTNTRVQADFVLKYVSGYQLSAKFMDIIPGGSSTVILNTNNVLYLEIPLVMKREYRPDYSWMLGLKPSGNFKIFPGGEYSSVNNSPSRFINSQAGFRSFDLGLVLGWEWRYHKYWALDIRYNQGLLDLTHDSFYRDNSTHLNSDLQVSLRYTPSKKNRHHAPKTLFPPPAGR